LPYPCGDLKKKDKKEKKKKRERERRGEEKGEEKNTPRSRIGCDWPSTYY
jgi:hypothetical protein